MLATLQPACYSFFVAQGVLVLPFLCLSELHISNGMVMSQFKDVLLTKVKLNPKDSIKQVLDEESFNDFEAALKDRLVTSAAIAASLRQLGVQISNMTIQRWRE